MCGIIGFASFNPSADVAGRQLSECTDGLAHRGPDMGGVLGLRRSGEIIRHVDGQPLQVGLGHRRLSILDLSDAGAQPMQGRNGHWLVFNGEIYNFIELREQLSAAGCRFETGTDTEVILAAYDHWGESCVQHFNGMWAFLLLDQHKNRLMASRDRMGIKPLYYTCDGRRIAWASEIKALMALQGGSLEIDQRELARYLVTGRIDDGKQTLYQGVYELRGGHSMFVDLTTGRQVSRRFWDLPEVDSPELSDDDVVERFGELLEDSTRIRLRSDVPLALTLSGGLDSSALMVAASRVNEGSLVGYTSHFPFNKDIDETEYAAQVARHCGAEHVLVEPCLDGLLQEEPLLTRHQELPFGSLSLFVHWAILKRIRQEGTIVVLTGQGATNCF